jgi:hypothetical protein
MTTDLAVFPTGVAWPVPSRHVPQWASGVGSARQRVSLDRLDRLLAAAWLVLLRSARAH